MLNKTSKIICIAAIFIAIIVAGAIFYASRNDNGSLGEREKALNLDNLSVNKAEKLDNIKNGNKPFSLTKAYVNSVAGFSFNYPDDFTVSEFVEEDGKIALTMQKAKTGEGFQIYITTYDDHDFVVSAEQIRRDLPDLPFSNSADVVVGGKTKGVAFFSENEAFGGPTAEVWFADGRNFYQATAYRKDVKILEEIIKSWKL